MKYCEYSPSIVIPRSSSITQALLDFVSNTHINDGRSRADNAKRIASHTLCELAFETAWRSTAGGCDRLIGPNGFEGSLRMRRFPSPVGSLHGKSIQWLA